MLSFLMITFQKDSSQVLEKDIPGCRRFTSQKTEQESTIARFLKSKCSEERNLGSGR